MEQDQPEAFQPEMGPKPEEALSAESMQGLMVVEALDQLAEALLFLPSEALTRLRTSISSPSTSPDQRAALIDQWDELARIQVRAESSDAGAEIGLELAKAALMLKIGDRQRARETVNDALWYADNMDYGFVREQFEEHFDRIDATLQKLYGQN